MRALDDLFTKLAKSPFRSGFKLNAKDLAYLKAKGMATILQHAEDVIEKRLSPATIANDGKQTPMRGHPVFVAQHATATCCRGCLQKWHRIPAGVALTLEEKTYILNILQRWFADYCSPNTP